MKPFVLLLTVLITLATSALGNSPSLTELAEMAVSGDSKSAAAAVKSLRAAGINGLDAIFERYGAEIESYKQTGKETAGWKNIAAAIDAVAMQKNAYASRLYWYTDLDEAKRRAKKENKPILTLRLLGDLNEEFSCANSRLFRSVLYPNAEVSKTLREKYILHWRSVRPAPRITIDFGDGRKIERTITGNSIHYILDANGVPIDALPGLYSPLAFNSYLLQASSIHAETERLPEAARRVALMKYRKGNFDRIVQARDKAVKETGVPMTETRTGTLAILAAPMAVAKMVVVDEYSILRVYDDFAKFEPEMRFDDWGKLAKAYSPEINVDSNTVAMVRRQNASTGLSEAEFKALFAKLDSFIAIDTTRNEFIFHTKLYEWLNQARGIVDVENLNARVYDQIFQTPNSDKWLGLYSADVYTALDGNGVVHSK